MTLGFDQKEDLRLRMMELEKKLAESEEERCKLEKTCNVLMRAFREEEKMHYKALNKKYEKFLEDCSMRRRRNDIILKSLCRIEDRARALFAKTERLKILKDRYISYLKISDFKKDESGLAWKNFPRSSTSQKINHDVTPKSVHWKSPYNSDVMLGRKEFIEPETNSSSKYASVGESLHKSFKENKEDSFEDIPASRSALEYKRLEEGRIRKENLWHKAPSEDRINIFENQENSAITLENFRPQKNNLENIRRFNIGNTCDSNNYSLIAQKTNLKKDLVPPEITDRLISCARVLSNVPEEKITAGRKETVAVTHHESIEKLKEALSVEDDEIENDKLENGGENQKIIEKDEIEINEKTNLTVNEDLNLLAISKTDIDPYTELINDAIDLQSDQIDEDVRDREPENPPVGLDGVDYQNETYPESYYEQPVHHNHTSIASDVILEEDETEQDVDQNLSEDGVKNLSIPNLESENESYLSRDNKQETGPPGEPYPEKQLVNSPDKGNDPLNETNKFREHEEEFTKLDTTGFDKDEQSKKSDSTIKSEKSNKRAPQSNLMHLLESDSESFQIEHGDLATGNEDSDFDFSFNQN